MSDPFASSTALLSGRRWLLTAVCLGALTVCAQGVGQEAARDAGKPATPPQLGLEAPKGTFGLYESRSSKKNYYETPELYDRARRRPYGFYHHYYGW